MKAINYSAPSSKDTIIMEEDMLPYFYEHLHCHNEMQITLILKGKGTLIMDKYKQPFVAGEIYFINARYPHVFCSDASYFKQPINNSAHAIHIYFDEKQIINTNNNLPELKEITFFLDKLKYGMQIPSENVGLVKEKIISIKNSHSFQRLLYLMQLLHYLSNELKDAKMLTSGLTNRINVISKNPRIKEIYDFTNNNYSKDIPLDLVAEICSMTPQSFCKFFKKHTSKTYIQHLQEVRINKACERIIHGDFETIESLAYQSGFNNSINFNRVFKKITKTSPKNYLKNHRTNN